MREWGLISSLGKLPAAVDAVEKTIRQQYPKLDIRPHSRIGHLGNQRVAAMLAGWQCDRVEKARRLVDLVTVSVLLDAGAGPDWRFIAPNGEEVRASEGLALASWEMFADGLFSTDPALKM